MIRRRSLFAGVVVLASLLAGTVTPADAATRATGTTREASAHASGLPWSSGAYTDLDAAQATAFAAWRGRPLDNISVFPSRDSWPAMLNPWWLSTGTIPAGFSGDLVVAVPLWPQNSNVTANADAQWRQLGGQIAGRDPDAYVRLGWEMNIGTYWKVTPSNRSQWIAGFNRAAANLHATGPKLRIVWNPNWGADQTGVDSRAVFQAVRSQVHAYGIDAYDSYPPSTTDAGAAARMTGPRGFADSLAYARANRKRFALPEWGVACTTAGCAWAGNAGGDDPRYVRDVVGFLGANAADVAFDSYFNETQDYIRSNLYPTTPNPLAGAAYVTALNGLAAQRAR